MAIVSRHLHMLKCIKKIKLRKFAEYTFSWIAFAWVFKRHIRHVCPHVPLKIREICEDIIEFRKLDKFNQYAQMWIDSGKRIFENAQ